MKTIKICPECYEDCKLTDVRIGDVITVVDTAECEFSAKKKC